MNAKEIELFTQAIRLAKDEFYFDAIHLLEEFIVEFKNSELVDDAIYDIGLCYFKLNQFERAIEKFELIISQYPDSTIYSLNAENEFGKTSTKALFGIFNCYLAQGNIESAKQILAKLKNDDKSYIIITNEKNTFYYLAKRILSNLFD